MRKTITAPVLFFIVAAFSVTNVGSADIPVRGFDGASYEYSYSEADRASDPASWLRAAKSGVAFAIARWERDAVCLYADSASLDSAGAELESWSSADIANRFSVWLRDRFFGREAAELKYVVADAMRVANGQYLYILDSDGSVSRDEAGNPRYLLPDDAMTLEQSRLAWKSGSASATKAALESYTNRLESLCPELLSYIPQNERGLYEPLIEAAVTSARGAISSELDALVAREERLFVARKTADVWSLRNQSENEAASVIANDLALKATAECDEKISVLNSMIETSSASGENLLLAGTEWLAAFKLQFDQGLTVWKNAEERFMVRRLEWERDAALAFDAGNEAWAEAFETLESERKAWEIRAGALFRSGEDAFSRASETLETNIREAKAEFEQASLERCTASSDRANAWVDVYLQAGATAAGAREGAGYWLSLLGNAVPAFSDPALGIWLDAEAAKPDASQQRKDWLAQARDCLLVYNQYAAKASESRDRLIADFGLAIGSGSGNLRDVLDAGVLAEDFCLDEYQVELIRAKAVEGYWARRVEVADAVFQYAVDISSGRATAGDNLRNLETASSEWNEALRLYDEAQTQLKDAGTLVTGAREAMSSAQQALSVAGARLENLNDEYSILMGVLLAGDASYIRDALVAKYQDLMDQSGLLSTEGASSEANLLVAYLEKARTFGHELEVERSGEALREAVNGIEGEPSLAQLKDIWAGILELPDPSGVPLDVGEYGLPQSGTEYAVALTLLHEMQERLDEAITATERTEIRERFKELLWKTARIAKAKAAAALEARFDGIALLGASSTDGWYADRTGGLTLDGSLATVLTADQRAASRSCLLARAELELEAVGVISGIITQNKASDEAISLADWWSTGGESAETAWAPLSSLVDFIRQNINAGDAEFNAGIEALSKGEVNPSKDGSIASFVRGRGYFQIGGVDIGSLSDPTGIEAVERARGRLMAYRYYGCSALALEEERYAAALEILTGALAPLGLAIGERGTLPQARVIVDSLFSEGAKTAPVLAGLLSAADQAASGAPGWLALELSGWKDSLLEYAAAKSLFLGLPTSGSSADYRAALSESSRQITSFSGVLAGLAGDASSALQALCLAASEPLWSEAEHAVLEEETVRRMSLMLRTTVNDFGFENPGGNPDWAMIARALTTEAETQFGFASFVLRTRAIESALEALHSVDAVVNARDPSLLAGTALDARLTDIWSSLDFEGLRAAAANPGNQVCRIAYSMQSMVFDPLADIAGGAERGDLIALTTPGPEGEPSWLDVFYASEGQDSGAIMQSLLELAAGAELDPWSLELARSRVEAMAKDSLSDLIAYRDGLRQASGTASGVAERLLAEFLAVGASDPGYFNWQVNLLGLSHADGLEEFTGALSSDEALIEEAFLGLGTDPCALSAASHVLVSLAISGNSAALEACSARAGMAASARANEILELKTTASGYAGEYSGDVLSWAFRMQEDDPSKAIPLARYIESGFIDDPVALYLNSECVIGDEFNSVDRWITETITENAERVLQSVGMTTALLTWTEACELALERATESGSRGELHWRQYLYSPAIVESWNGLPAPLAAGDPEGDLSAVPRMAASWAEGALADAYEESERRTRSLSEGLDSWSQGIAGLVAPSAPATYLAAPEKPFSVEDVIRASTLAMNEYQSAAGAYASLGYRRTETIGTLAGYAKAFITASDQEAVSARLAVLQNEQISARAACDAAMNSYHQSGAGFDAAGAAYELAYSRANASYSDQERARSRFELEDAIRRWAGTAYLAATENAVPNETAASYRSPGEELEYAKVSHDRAAVILGSLLGLQSETGELRQYADPEYLISASEYDQNYRNLVLLSRARETLGGTLDQAYAENDTAYAAYQSNLYGNQAAGCLPVASVPLDYSAYTFPADASAASWPDFLKLRADGSLGLAYGADFRLTPVDAATASQLAGYFQPSPLTTDSIDTHASSRYELDVRAWSSRVAGYMVSQSTYSVWADARDHLMSSLSKANPEYSSLASSVMHADNLNATIGGKRIDGNSISDLLSVYGSGTLAAEQSAAWESMSAQERSDLEFYVVMTLSGGAERSGNSIATATKLKEYQYVSQIVSSRIEASKRLATALGISAAASWSLGVLLSWTPFGPALLGAAVVQYGLSVAATADANDWQSSKTTIIDSGLESQRQTMLSGLPALISEISGIQTTCAVYQESCQRIALIQGTSQQGQDALAGFRESLQAIDGMDAEEINGILQQYEAYVAEIPAAYSGVSDAISSLYRWTLAKRDAARSAMEMRYFDDQRQRQLAEAAYRVSTEDYLAGTSSSSELESAMQSAFGDLAASGKTHLAQLAAIERTAVFDAESDPLARQCADAVTSLAGLTARASELRCSAELLSREAGWDLQRRDLNDKRLSWRQSASLILERGRADFEDGADLLRGQAASWIQRFSDGYSARKPAWDLAYAGMQDEKLTWVAQATQTAGDASADAMLALMSPDAEAGARKLDSFTVSRLAFEVCAPAYVDTIMDQAGIVGMDVAFESQSGSVSALSLTTRKGVSYASSLDSGSIMTAAADFAENTRQRFSGVQARLVAARTRSAALAAVEGLASSVRAANESFSKRMAEVFIDGGMWKRQGSRYVKDIVVHSTVREPYILEQAGVESFRSYAMEDWKLATDMSDGILAGLDGSSVQALIGKAQREVQIKYEAVFGTAEELGEAAVASRTRRIDLYRSERGVVDTRIINWIDDEGKTHSKEVATYGMIDVLDHTEEQAEGAGEFGRHLGYSPVVRLGANPDDGESGVFQAAGSGELGRLMASYIYWSLKEGKGWSEANKPVYEKDLWDDRGDWLQAPTIRTVADLGVTVAAGVLTGGVGALAMNLVDDAAFGLLDVSGGYRSLEQAGLDFGKKAALSAVNYYGSQMFGGTLSRLATRGGLDEVLGTTMLTGLKTATNGMASSALGAVNLTYDASGGISGLGFDDQVFKENAFGEASVASYLGSMACAAFNSSIDFSDAYSGKVWAGVTTAGSMAATEGAKFAAHLGYAVARGTTSSELLDEAWKRHGGIAIDVANLGSIVSVAGFLDGISSNGYSASDRGGYNRVASAFSSVGLTLNFGSNGIKGSLGGGGYDLLRMGIQAGKGMLLDAKLEKYALEQGSTVASVLKTAIGYGDSAAEETVWRLVNGKDTLSTMDTGSGAETVTGSSGNRIITLMAEGGGTSAMLDMAVKLQHEAWRDGKTGTAQDQRNETMRAAVAHTQMTLELGLGNEYSSAMASLIGGDQNYQDDLENYLGGDFAAYVGRTYDASGDFWKLTKEGRLVNDGKARMLAEIVNDDGTVGWHTVEGSQSETSTAAALVHYLGQSRAMELFGGSLCNITRYDDQTLHDVLNLDEIDIKTIRKNPGEAERIIATASSGQRERLLGEALMKDAGIKWNVEAGIWSGDGNSLTLSDRAIMGTAAIRSSGSGTYERFSITSEIERRQGAYGVWINGNKGDVGEGNTSLTFTKWDIDSGEKLATILAGGAWNSVDNSYGQLDSGGKPIGADQQYQIAFGPTLQGNTIAEGSLNLRLALTPKADWGDVFILSDTKTIAGERIMADGRRPGHPLDYRWLGHATQYGTSDGCPVYKRGDDITDQFEALMQSLETYGLYGGYSISGLLIDDNDFPYRPGYRKGVW